MVQTELVKYAERKPKARSCETRSDIFYLVEIPGRDSERGSCETRPLIIILVEILGRDLQSSKVRTLKSGGDSWTRFGNLTWLVHVRSVCS
jgi:hypothetical protein